MKGNESSLLELLVTMEVCNVLSGNRFSFGALKPRFRSLYPVWKGINKYLFYSRHHIRKV